MVLTASTHHAAGFPDIARCGLTFVDKGAISVICESLLSVILSVWTAHPTDKLHHLASDKLDISITLNRLHSLRKGKKKKKEA